jgi:hypothetical protein
MMQVVGLAVLLLLPGCVDAVNLRQGSTSALNAVDAGNSNRTSLSDSSFSPAFVSAVNSFIFPAFTQASFLSTKVTASSHSVMSLAARGAAELGAEKAVKSIDLPRSTVDLLRSGHNMAAGASMWKADVDVKRVEKAIVNLNAMVFAAQIRLDAKNDECEEFKAKYTETLDQINGDLARLGEELSNTARAILVHNGGIDTIS